MPFKVWQGADGGRNMTGSYCPHSNTLFFPWHRPYLALFEVRSPSLSLTYNPPQHPKPPSISFQANAHPILHNPLISSHTASPLPTHPSHRPTIPLPAGGKVHSSSIRFPPALLGLGARGYRGRNTGDFYLGDDTGSWDGWGGTVGAESALSV